MPVFWESQSEPIPGYQLLERLGQGGFGEVWRVRAPGGVLKAIKFVFGEISGEKGEQPYAAQELKALDRVRTVRHPFILSIDRFEVRDGQLMIVMELADRNLFDRYWECRREGLAGIPRTELLKYLAEAAEALDLMNQHYGLQHLDVKPQNLFVVAGHIKVGDFGLVKDLEGAAARISCGVTPVYAPPETFDGWVSQRSDQYSLAIVYQELLSGQRPFAGTSAAQLMRQHLEHEPDLESLPVADRPLIARALEKHPDARHGSCTELITKLQHAGTEEPLAPAPPPALCAETDGAQQNADLSTALTARSMDAASATQTPLRLLPILGRGPLEASEDGTLCPTLVIGVGATGIACVGKLHDALAARYGKRTSWPAVRLLTIDCDEDSATLLTDRAPEQSQSPEPVLCKLQKSSHYLSRWNQLKHLSDWLDPNSLFQISRSGTTNRQRVLGRLALVDNYRSVLRRIGEEIAQLMQVRNLEAAITATGQTLRRTQPRVYVVTAMGGGTGSGMLIDLCYLIRRALLEAGDSRPDVHAMLVAGIGPEERAAEVCLGNHARLVEDLERLTRPDAEFVGRYEATGNADRFTGPPVHAVYLFDRTASRTQASDGDRVLDVIAQYLAHVGSGTFGRELDQTVQKQRWPAFRSFGWFSLAFPYELLVRHTAASLCRHLVSSWRQPLQGVGAAQVRESAEDSLRTAGFDPSRLAHRVLESWNNCSADPIHVQIAERIARLERELNESEGTSQDQLYTSAFADLTEMAGDNLADGLLERQPRDSLASVIGELGDALAEPAVQTLVRRLDEPGARFDRARQTGEAFAAYFLRMADQQQQLARSGDKAVSHRLRELRDEIAAASGGRRTGRDLVPLMEEYARSSIECRVREASAEVYLSLHHQLMDKLRKLNDIEAKMSRLEDELKQMAVPVEPGASVGCAQHLFPGGQLTLKEASEDFRHELYPHLPALEEVVQEQAVHPLGGLWSASRAAVESVDSLATALLACSMGWVQSRLPPQGVADFVLARHGAQAAARTAELKAYFEWAEPSVGTQQRSGPNVVETFLLSVPDTAAGRRLQSEVLQAGRSPSLSVSSEQDECVFCRLLATNSIAVFLPEWLRSTRALRPADKIR